MHSPGNAPQKHLTATHTKEWFSLKRVMLLFLVLAFIVGGVAGVRLGFAGEGDNAPPEMGSGDPIQLEAVSPEAIQPELPTLPEVTQPEVTTPGAITPELPTLPETTQPPLLPELLPPLMPEVTTPGAITPGFPGIDLDDIDIEEAVEVIRYYIEKYTLLLAELQAQKYELNEQIAYVRQHIANAQTGAEAAPWEILLAQLEDTLAVLTTQIDEVYAHIQTLELLLEMYLERMFALPGMHITVGSGITHTIAANHTGNITVNNGGTLVLNAAHIITGTVTVGSGGRFYMSNGEITGSGSRGVHITGANAFMSMTGGRIHGNGASTLDGGGVNVTNGRFEMSGGFIEDNRARYGGGLNLVGTTPSAVVSGDAVIRGNRAYAATSSGSGGGVNVNNTARFYLEGGHIYNNVSVANRGGGIHFGSSSRGVITGGTIGHDNPSLGNRATSNAPVQSMGGGINVSSNSQVTMSGGRIVGNSVTAPGGHGGGVNVRTSQNFTVTGTAIIENNSAATQNGRGGGIHIENNSRVNLSGSAIIRNNNAPLGGGISIENGTSTVGNRLFMDGGQIYNNTASRGGGVYMHGIRSSFVMTGGMIGHENRTLGNNAVGAGGGIEVDGGAVLTLGSTTTTSDIPRITGNTAVGSGGGGVRVNVGSTFYLYHGRIDNNQAVNGGGIYFAPGTSGHIGQPNNTGSNSDVVIEDNRAQHTSTANGNGGGITVSGTEINMYNGSIRNNTATNRGGGVRIAHGAGTESMGYFLSHLIIYDGLVYGNRALGSNMHTLVGTTLRAPGEGGGISINLTTGASGAVGHSVLTMHGGHIFDNQVTGANGGHGGGVHLFDNSRFYMHGGMVGHTNPALGNRATRGGGIDVSYGATLIISEAVAAAVAEVMLATTTPAAITASPMSSTIPAVINNTATTDGGGISLDGEGTHLDLTIGDVAHNNAGQGGGISLTNGASLYLSGTATIFDNTALTNGGGIFANGQDTTIDMTGGTIGHETPTLGNTASRGAGVDLIGAAAMEMDGGRILHNTATADGGGGIHLTHANTQFTMYSGDIDRNTTATAGGGIRSRRSAVITINGGSILGNTATLGGGIDVGIDDVSASYLYIHQLDDNIPTIIYNNTATGTQGGGGIQIGASSAVPAMGSIVTMTGGAIVYNHAPNGNGGGVRAPVNTLFTMTGGQIYRNTAINGGGVWVNGSGTVRPSTFNFYNGTIGHTNPAYGNTAINGGGVFVGTGATFTTRGDETLPGEATITNNIAQSASAGGSAGTGNGGGIYISAGTTVSLGSGTIIHQNHARTAPGYISSDHNAGNGGGIYTMQSLTIGDGVQITENTAYSRNNSSDVGSGGGIYARRHALADLPVAIDIAGGLIYRNTAFNQGGGIAITNGSTAPNPAEATTENPAPASLTISADAVISYNQAQVGGGVSAYRGLPGNNNGGVTVNFTGGTIHSNQATGTGGGLQIGSTAANQAQQVVFNMSGTAHIDNNTANNGGGVRVQGHSRFNLSGGDITRNRNVPNTGLGSAIHLLGNSHLYITGGTIGDPSNVNPTVASPGLANIGNSTVHNQNSRIDMSDGYIHSNLISTGIGGAVRNEAGSSSNMDIGFFMTGGLIAHNTFTGVAATNGGGGVHNAGLFEMSGTAAIRNNISHRNGGGVWTGNFFFHMSENAVIAGNTAMSNGPNPGNPAANPPQRGGGGVYVRSGQFTMEGGTIGGDTPEDANIVLAATTTPTPTEVGGGGVLVTGDAFFEMEEGTRIVGNLSHNDGGGLYVSTTEPVVIIDGTISHNTARLRGGGVYIGLPNTSFEMHYPTSIAHNVAEWEGGGVFNRSVFNMVSGEIVDNRAEDNAPWTTNAAATRHSGGGVFNMGTASTFTMGIPGATPEHIPIIARNLAEGQRGGGVFIVAGATMTMYDGHIHSNRVTALRFPITDTHPGGGGVCAFSTTANPTSTFHMHGGTIGGTTRAYANRARHGGGVMMRDNSHFYMTGGYIINNTAVEYRDGTHHWGVGGGVRIDQQHSRGTITQGTIAYNEANHGGGISIWGGGGTSNNVGTLILGTATPGSNDPGQILVYDNHARSNGGGIRTAAGGIVNTFPGALVYDNQAGIDGGGLHASGTAAIPMGDIGSTLNMYGGTFDNNQAIRNGGGVWLGVSTTLTMADGAITDNHAYAYGGGVYVAVSDTATSQLNATGGHITGNHANLDGGGIFAEDYLYGATIPTTYFNSLSITAAVQFTGNTAGNGSFRPPTNFADFTTRSPRPIMGTGRSPDNNTRNTHLLNNYDINFRSPFEITYAFYGDAPYGIDPPDPRIADVGDSEAATPQDPYEVPAVRNGVPGTWTFNGWQFETQPQCQRDCNEDPEDCECCECTPDGFTMPNDDVHFIGTWTWTPLPPPMGVNVISTGAGFILVGAALSAAAAVFVVINSRRRRYGTAA